LIKSIGNDILKFSILPLCYSIFIKNTNYPTA